MEIVMKALGILAPLTFSISLAACGQESASDVINDQAEATSEHADLAERRAAGAQTEEEAQVFEEHSDRLDARARELEKEADRLVE
jgi:cell division protein FtsB